MRQAGTRRATRLSTQFLSSAKKVGAPLYSFQGLDEFKSSKTDKTIILAQEQGTA
jgi:hypothetical protein